MVDVKLIALVSMCLIAIVTAVPRNLFESPSASTEVVEHEDVEDQQPIIVSQADMARILTRMNMGNLLKEDRTLRNLLSKILRANNNININHNSDNSFIKRGHIWK